MKKCKLKCKLKWMEARRDQGAVIKFNFLLGKMASEMYALMQEAYDISCLSRATVFSWHKQFCEGRVLAELEQHTGQPREASSIVNVNTVEALIREDCSLTCHKVAIIMDILKTTVENSLKHELHM